MTAVEYAEELINVILYYIDFEDEQRIKEIFNDAKKIEKQQIIEAYCFGCKDITENEEIFPRETSEQYYNETFKK